jgi:hypothetical protein
MPTFHPLSLLDVIQAVSDCATSDRETVAYLINSGQVRLCGDFPGAMVELSARRKTAASGRGKGTAA